MKYSFTFCAFWKYLLIFNDIHYMAGNTFLFKGAQQVVRVTVLTGSVCMPRKMSVRPSQSRKTCTEIASSSLSAFNVSS